ncbi:fimbria/pilus outer membrane usher protein [Providencia rettgeri]|uniref:fimbria/pilus outer membrane usher protein n=1 Tax=Providencia rettgeri TaxID=587 RepID=UPI002551EEE3|nr:fimbria/pilus outer membrane usher protein [Providencia rettgeri]MDK7744883.1 fimbria/pilus outer membrane usher protein [Providencia rettgeri]MDK7758755.1 fimbria/pilus outer membrane usher protein [Providencia rettgeri]
MSILNHKHSLSALVSLFIFGLCPATANTVETLYLDVSINKRALPNFVEVRKEGDTFWLSESEINALSLNTNDLVKQDGWVQLTPQQGIKIDYDPLSQSLSIMASEHWLAGTQKPSIPGQGFLLTENQIAPEIKGGVLNYDLFASHDTYSKNISAFTELRLIGYGSGHLTTSFNNQLSRTPQSTDNKFNRLMTTWQTSNVDTLNTFMLGDGITGGQSWSNQVRFGGVHLSHNYTVQPNYNITSKPIYSNTAVLPSTVDLYIDGIRNSTQRVDPGQFTLNTAPHFSGAGNAQLIITDINGQQQKIDVSLYNTNQLISKGLYTWDLSLGWLREDYNERSFGYNSRLMVVGDGRYGVTDNLTLTGHNETNSALQNIGAGYHWLVTPYLGVIQGNMAWSQYQNQSGTQWGAGWQWNNRQFSLSVNHQQRENNYADVATQTGNLMPLTSDNAFMSWSFETMGTFGGGWVSRDYPSTQVQYANLSWSKTYTHFLTVSINGARELGNRQNSSMYLMVSIPLSTENYVSLQTNYDNKRVNQQIQYRHNLLPDKSGWGGGITQQLGENNNLHLDLINRSASNEWQVGYNRDRSNNNYYVSSNGAIGVLDEHVYFMRRLGNAFAIADTSGVPDIPIYLQNIEVGKTDKQGRLLLNDLYGYEPQKIRINALSLSADYRIKDTEKIIVPREGNGTLVSFNLYRANALLLNVKQNSGIEIPFAASVSIHRNNASNDDVEKTLVGYGSQIYLENWQTVQSIDVVWPKGKCQISLPQMNDSAEAFVEKEVICF